MTRIGRRWLSAGSLVMSVVAGAVIWNQLSPPARIPQTLYPRAGTVLRSESAGAYNEVVDIRDGKVITRATLQPYAKGPPLHYHDGFDETFVVAEGTLSLEVEGEIRQLRAGESFHVKAGVPHRPFNASDTPVRLQEGPAFPVQFGACLSQLYGFMDQPGMSEGPQVLLQLSLLRRDCDTHLAGLPRFVEDGLLAVAAPVARALGYQPFRPEWAPADLGPRTAAVEPR